MNTKTDMKEISRKTNINCHRIEDYHLTHKSKDRSTQQEPIYLLKITLYKRRFSYIVKGKEVMRRYLCWIEMKLKIESFFVKNEMIWRWQMCWLEAAWRWHSETNVTLWKWIIRKAGEPFLIWTAVKFCKTLIEIKKVVNDNHLYVSMSDSVKATRHQQASTP